MKNSANKIMIFSEATFDDVCPTSKETNRF
jgi:hypothetical protein